MDLPSTIHYFGELLGCVISEQESPARFEIEEKSARMPKRTAPATQTPQRV